MVVYKLPTLSREEIQTLLELTEVDLKQTRFYQEIFAEDRQAGEAALILRLLQRRCGVLPQTLVERVVRLSVVEQ